MVLEEINEKEPNKAHALNPQSLKLLGASDAQRSTNKKEIK